MRKITYLMLNLVVGVLWVPVAVVTLRWAMRHLPGGYPLPGYVGVFAGLCVGLVLLLFLLSKVYYSSKSGAEINPSRPAPNIGIAFLGWCAFLILAACAIFTVMNEP